MDFQNPDTVLPVLTGDAKIVAHLEPLSLLPIELENELRTQIPLARAMDVSVVEARPERVVLSAPLAANMNHRATVFGGSASALATLAAWSLVNLRLAAEGLETSLVIQRNSMAYEIPIDGRFTALAEAPAAEDWGNFLRVLQRRGKARIKVTAELHFAGRVAGRFAGEFVAFHADNNPRCAANVAETVGLL
jgi:thioesterase domain-containing protein